MELYAATMYIHDLHIRNLRLLRDLKLSFVDDCGEPRMWTVLIGRNGSGKTSILQALALASTGYVRANALAAETSVSLPDRRQPNATLQVDAVFGFGSTGDDRHRLRSRLSMSPGTADLLGGSEYEHDAVRACGSRPPSDPLQVARSVERSRWFIAGYGTARNIAAGHRNLDLGKPSQDRLVSLFRPVPLVGLDFARVLPTAASDRFGHLLHALLTNAGDLVPDMRQVKLAGHGSVRMAADLRDHHRVEQALPGGSLELPAHWLSHGYQATLAWLADLVGQYLLDAGGEASLGLEPSDMEGLVLIDQLDMSLHPAWLAGLVRVLGLTFPRLQFVATAHSPALVDALPPETIVELGIDEAGNVQAMRPAKARRIL